MNLDTFKKYLKMDYLRSNTYIINFEPPSFARTIPVTSDTMQKLYRSAVNVPIPGSAWSTFDHTMHQLNWKLPYLREYEPITITFMNDSESTHRRFFENWHAGILNEQTGNFRYLDEYSTNLQIIEFNRQGNTAHEFELHQAFPVSIGEMSLGYANNDEVETFTVTFAYTKYTMK